MFRPSSVLSRLSCHSCPILVVLPSSLVLVVICLASSPICPVQAGASPGWPACRSVWPICLAWPVPVVLLWLFCRAFSFMAVLSWLFCYSCLVPGVQSQLSCPCCHVPAVLSSISRPGFTFPYCPSRLFLSQLSCPICPVLVVLSLLSCPSTCVPSSPVSIVRPVLSVLSLMPYPSCPVPTCHALAALSWLSWAVIARLSKSFCMLYSMILKIECRNTRNARKKSIPVSLLLLLVRHASPASAFRVVVNPVRRWVFCAISASSYFGGSCYQTELHTLPVHDHQTVH
jgi:hypothetical protein